MKVHIARLHTFAQLKRFTFGGIAADILQYSVIRLLISGKRSPNSAGSGRAAGSPCHTNQLM
jgi:hypothetical protein